MSHVLSLLIFMPLVAAGLTFLVPERWAKAFALGASLVPVALAAWALHVFVPGHGLQMVEHMAWLPAFGISYALGVDGIALPLIVLTAVLTPLCLLASWHVDKKPQAFFAAFLALEGAVNGVFAAQDFVLFYLFWEAMLIPMFLLIGMWGGENRVYAALKFFLYTFLGSVLMLVAGLYMAHVAGSFSLAAWAGLNLPLPVQSLMFVAFFSAFAVKVPMWPLHTWLPDAHVQAPTAGSVILAGVLLKLGAYGFLRFCLPLWPLASAYFAPTIFVLSAIAVVYAALVAYVQTDIKKLIAYSSVSHMGLVTLGIFAGTPTSLDGAMLVVMNHGIVSAGLFLAVGVIYDRLHTRELAKFGGLVHLMPGYAFVVMVLTLAAVALPGTNGFVGEFLALAGSYSAAPVATLVATSGVVLGALYMLWLVRKMMFGEQSAFVVAHTSHLTDLSVREWVIFLPLLVAVPLFGLVPGALQDLWKGDIIALHGGYAKAMAPAVVVGAVVPAAVVAPAAVGISSTVVPVSSVQPMPVSR